MSGTRQQLRHAAAETASAVKYALGVVAEPLRVDPDAAALRLPVPDAQTTTMVGEVGWGSRPAAVLACPGCESEIYQHRPTTTIDCPECWREVPPERFPDVELRYLLCPECGGRMRDGRRHPEQFDVPEWASCDTCQYHWELEHF